MSEPLVIACAFERIPELVACAGEGAKFEEPPSHTRLRLTAEPYQPLSEGLDIKSPYVSFDTDTDLVKVTPISDANLLMVKMAFADHLLHVVSEDEAMRDYIAFDNAMAARYTPPDPMTYVDRFAFALQNLKCVLRLFGSIIRDVWATGWARLRGAAA